MAEISRLLDLLAGHEPHTAEQLLPLVYDELRRLAEARLAREKPGQTLNATALVHEAYLRLVGKENPQWKHRGHFFAAAAEAMRRILIESARRRRQQKRGGDLRRIELADDLVRDEDRDQRLLDLDEALSKLQTLDQRKADVVKLRFFAGLTNADVAQAFGCSAATTARDWAFARAWLKREIGRK